MIYQKLNRIMMTLFTVGQPISLEVQMWLPAVIVVFSRLSTK